MMTGKKVNTKPVDYAALNQLSKDFETRFVPQTKLSAKQAFWSQNSRNSKETNLSTSTTIVEIRPMLYDSNVIAKETNMISIADSKETLKIEEDNFGKCFVPQREEADEQALHPVIDQSASSPIKIEAPRELPKVELQAKDMTIKKLKAHIKRIFETSTSKSVKKDFDEIETINIELEHRVTRLIPKNEHLK
nr:hypothetical protein [Tanacetum cinerariifolium]